MDPGSPRQSFDKLRTVGIFKSPSTLAKAEPAPDTDRVRHSSSERLLDQAAGRLGELPNYLSSHREKFASFLNQNIKNILYLVGVYDRLSLL